MRIALAQINSTVGDIAGNCRKILSVAALAKERGADVTVFPELAVAGYPPRDLLLKPQFIADNLRGLELIASRTAGVDIIIGYADRNDQPVGRPLYNAAALLRDGKIVSRHYKSLLPTYDVFDESRYFEPGPPCDRCNVVRIGDVSAGLTICEDLWNDRKLLPRPLYHRNPIADLHTAGAQVVINLSASPFVAGKQDFRLELFRSQARQFGLPIIYVNQVGGNDELVFDGNSAVVDATGNVIAQARDFEEDLVLVDLENGTGRAHTDPHTHARDSAAIRKALVLGLRDYVHKCGFKSVVLGLSGGIDSALTAVLAVEALGKDKVVGISMPSRFSSDHSIADAEQLARNLGIAFHIVPIRDIHQQYESTLEPFFAGKPHDVTEENLQARVRGAILMAFSNKYNHLLLTTGNKSELAVGYCTLYGDMCGGLAILSDVPKTIVYQLAELINHEAACELIPRNSITKPPSAELRPNQTDQDSLPPYEVLDAILHHYIEQERSVGQIIAQGFDPATVLRVVKLVDRSEYKRRQAAPGIKVTSRAFGYGRRMPIAQRYEQEG